MDSQLLEQQLAGYEARGKELRASEQIFLKVQGLREQEEKARAEVLVLETEIQGIKDDIAAAKKKRNNAMETILQPIRESLDAVLPVGQSVLSADDSGKLFIGWKINGVDRHYNGLSGGELVSFNLALAKALGAEIVTVEAAELDNIRAAEQLDALNDFDGQVIVATCHRPASVPEGWSVVEL